MTDARARRIAVLTAAARNKSEQKAKAAGKAIRALVKRGDPVTFHAVQREAGVSHAFLYNHPELRGRVERLRSQARPRPVPPAPTGSADPLVLALNRQIDRLKQQHRKEVQTLRTALQQARREPRTPARTRSSWSRRKDLARRPVEMTTLHRSQQRPDLP